jgi:hypothetical protein
LCGLEVLGRRLEIAMDSGSAKREAAPRPGRDNSVSSSRHNLLTASFWLPNRREAESVHENKYYQFNDLNQIWHPFSRHICFIAPVPRSFSPPLAARPR